MAGVPPMVTVAPAAKLVPVIVTGVPPSVVPAARRDGAHRHGRVRRRRRRSVRAVAATGDERRGRPQRQGGVAPRRSAGWREAGREARAHDAAPVGFGAAVAFCGSSADSPSLRGGPELAVAGVDGAEDLSLQDLVRHGQALADRVVHVVVPEPAAASGEQQVLEAWPARAGCASARRSSSACRSDR